ncbi:hypothetical protein [Desulfoluna spongiiphila]|uniref:Uncharacterized protein n=1 Tax=Desulfoluna spongiiphila TaxID=419481 RepID=A0A1G5H106_9BACT|nr:hypothetical protein [Desulfoluna spongiiphila]SCY57532.1 hypothetical protein SAMN05216233_11251 [Desulfoluna spongiiphila]VVS94716.1 hypothetical protein DBB_42880 [Desulfoluna spongiiphila]
MREKITEVMQKITFLEKDLDLQKHILRALPSGEEEQGREVLGTIADIKGKIDACRLEIKALDPDEYDRMIRFEGAAAAFKEAAEGREFVTVVDLNTHVECRIETVDGTAIDCLVKARDTSGEWLIMTVDGEVMTLAADQVPGEDA